MNVHRDMVTGQSVKYQTYIWLTWSPTYPSIDVMVQHIANCQSDKSVTETKKMSDLPHHAFPLLQLLLETYPHRARDQVAHCPVACMSRAMDEATWADRIYWIKS